MTCGFYTLERQLAGFDALMPVHFMEITACVEVMPGCLSVHAAVNIIKIFSALWKCGSQN